MRIKMLSMRATYLLGALALLFSGGVFFVLLVKNNRVNLNNDPKIELAIGFADDALLNQIANQLPTQKDPVSPWKNILITTPQKQMITDSNNKTVRTPEIIEKNGITLGFICVTENELAWTTQSDKSGTPPPQFDTLLHDITQLKSKVDHVIVSLPWDQNATQTKMHYAKTTKGEAIHKMVDAGAQVIHGHRASLFNVGSRSRDKKKPTNLDPEGQTFILYDDVRDETMHTPCNNLTRLHSIKLNKKEQISWVHQFQTYILLSDSNIQIIQKLIESILKFSHSENVLILASSDNQNVYILY